MFTVEKLAQFTARMLNDAVLGFLALISLFLLMAPAVFSISESVSSLVLLFEYTIIFLFALEYIAAYCLAQGKRQYLLDRWRIVDALIIVSGLVPLLPFGPEVLRNSPVLRLFRIGRLALLGTRSGIALRSSSDLGDEFAIGQDAEIRVASLGASGTRLEAISWETGIERIQNAESDWIFISGISEDKLKPVADALQIPVKVLQSLYQSSVPRFETLEGVTTFFIRQPLAMRLGERLRRTPVLLVGTSNNVVVLSREHTDLERRIESRLSTTGEDIPRLVRATLALKNEILSAYTEVINVLEASLIQTELNQARLNDENFLAETFALRADILKVRSSLKHLRNVVRDISNGKLLIAGSDGNELELYRFLADEVNDLYEDNEDLRESLQGLVDLRLNVSSFQMNRVMRVLALLTALVLIPTTAGGLLGMNLLDAPWPGTLLQVAFGVAAGMSLSLYIFAIKGWLR